MSNPTTLEELTLHFQAVETWANMLVTLSPRRYHNIHHSLSLVSFHAAGIVAALDELRSSPHHIHRSQAERTSIGQLREKTLSIIYTVDHRHRRLIGEVAPYEPHISGFGTTVWRRLFVAVALKVFNNPLVSLEDGLKGVGIASEPDDECPVCLEEMIPNQSTMRLPCHEKHRLHTDCLIVGHFGFFRLEFIISLLDFLFFIFFCFNLNNHSGHV